jgi:hypothetical protein
MQIHGENFWETYSPVVQTTTVCLMLVLSLLLGLHTRSINFTLAFPQAPIDVETFIEILTEFSVPDMNEQCVLELKNTLYGLHQARLNWFETLRTHLTSIGFWLSIIDPCCFIKDDLILSDEGNVAAYLGLDVNNQLAEGKPNSSFHNHT